MIRYDLIRIVKVFQYRYTNDAATNFPTSKELAIITTGINDPENIAANPNTLKNAADPAINKTVSIKIDTKTIGSLLV